MDRFRFRFPWRLVSGHKSDEVSFWAEYTSHDSRTICTPRVIVTPGDALGALYHLLQLVIRYESTEWTHEDPHAPLKPDVKKDEPTLVSKVVPARDTKSKSDDALCKWPWRLSLSESGGVHECFATCFHPVVLQTETVYGQTQFECVLRTMVEARVLEHRYNLGLSDNPSQDSVMLKRAVQWARAVLRPSDSGSCEYGPPPEQARGRSPETCP